MILFNLTLSLILAYEIHRLIKFNFFFKLKSIMADYPKIREKLNEKLKLRIYNEVIKITLVELVYALICIIGLFTINRLYFIIIIGSSFISTTLFRSSSNKIIRKIIHTIDIVISILCVSLVFISYYSQLKGINFRIF